MYEICLFFHPKYMFFFVCVAILYILILISRAESQRNRMWCCSSTKIVEDLMNFQKKALERNFEIRNQKFLNWNQKPKIDLLKFILMGILCIWHALRLLQTPGSTTLFVPFVESAKFFKLWNDCMCFYPPNLPFKLSHPTLLWGFVRKGLCHEGWPHQKRVKGWKHLCTNFTIRFVQKGTRFESMTCIQFCVDLCWDSGNIDVWLSKRRALRVPSCAVSTAPRVVKSIRLCQRLTDPDGFSEIERGWFTFAKQKCNSAQRVASICRAGMRSTMQWVTCVTTFSERLEWKALAGLTSHKAKPRAWFESKEWLPMETGARQETSLRKALR